MRGGLVHTFGSLAGFIVVTFLCVGLYILEEAFANPLDAGAAAVITAAFIITLAVMLLVFLLEPGKRIRTANPDRTADSATAELKPISKPVAGAVRHDHLRSNLSYQRFYVDHSRIRPVDLLLDSSAGNSWKVALFQDDAVMHLVACGNESQRSHRHFLLAGDSAPCPSSFRERAKQRETGAAHERKFLGEAGKSSFAEPAILNEVVLFESGKRRLVSTRDPQRPVGEDPFGIRDMPKYFLHGPFSRGVAKTSVSLAPSRK